MKKVVKRRNVRINLTVPPEVVEYLQEMAKELNTTMSGLVVQFVMFQKAMDDNKDLNRLAEMMIKKALKAK